MQNPRMEHWTELKCVLPYLQHTKDMVFTYQNFQSTSGMVFTFAGGPIAWRSKRQSSVAHLSIEAEYVAVALTTK